MPDRRRRARPSIREVAERAEAAVSSVSRVLSGHPDVSDEMRDRVLAAVEELGYSPDAMAQSLRRRETRSVGFVVVDISNPLFAEIVKGTETVLRDAGYAMLLTNSEGDPERDASHVRLFEGRRVDALVLSTAQEHHPATIEALERIDVPFVLLDREKPDGLAASRVLSDHRAGMREAVGHLLELGHRRIAFIAGAPVRPTNERLEGVKEAYAARSLKPSFIVQHGAFSTAHGEAATDGVLRRARPPTALIAGSNQILLGVIRALRRRNVRLGVDVSLVSCDDVPISELHEPPIAVIARDTREMGAAAARLLLRQLGGESSAEDVVLPTRFVARPSCGPPPAPPRR